MDNLENMLSGMRKEILEKVGEYFILSQEKGVVVPKPYVKSRMFGDTIKSDDERYQIIRDGDEVITPAATFPTTSNVLLINNLLPVFVDIELGTYNMNPKDIESAITDKTRLIM